MEKISFYVITSPAFAPDNYTNIFRVNQHNNERYLARITYEPTIDLAPEQPVDLKGFLPREIVDKIIDYLILSYIKGMNYEFANQLIFLDLSTTRRFYNQWFPVPTSNRVMSKLHRISQTFELMQKIVDMYVQFPNEEHDHYFALSLQHTSTLFNPKYDYYPWNFNGNIDMIQIPRPGIYTIEDFRAFVTGPYITDIVWMNGRSDKGVVASNYFRLPVIVLVLMDKEEEIIPTKVYIENNPMFRTFAKMLKLAFGPTTGVFFAVQGEYIFDDQVLVEL